MHGYFSLRSWSLRDSQLDPPLRFDSQRPVAIQLQLVKPVWTLGQITGAQEKHWLNEGRVHLPIHFIDASRRAFSNQSLQHYPMPRVPKSADAKDLISVRHGYFTFTYNCFFLLFAISWVVLRASLLNGFSAQRAHSIGHSETTGALSLRAASGSLIVQ